MLEKQIGTSLIRIVQSDITERETEAIVNAANNHLWMGSGVAGAIKAKGGAIIEKEAMAQGPIPVGDVVVTSAGLLPNKYVIHAAGMGQNLTTSETIIQEVTINVLKRCVELEIESVSFPSIGTGVGGFPITECAQIMLRVTHNHLRKNVFPKLVEFVLWNSAGYDAFATELEKFFPSTIE